MSKRARAGKSGSQRKKQNSHVTTPAISTSDVHHFAEYSTPGHDVETYSLDPERTTKVFPGHFTPALCAAESVLAMMGVHGVQYHVVSITYGFRGSALVVFDTKERATAFVDMAYLSTSNGYYHICSMTCAAIHRVLQSMLHGDSGPVLCGLCLQRSVYPLGVDGGGPSQAGGIGSRGKDEEERKLPRENGWSARFLPEP